MCIISLMIGYIYMPRMIVIGIMILITRLLCVSWRKFVEEEKLGSMYVSASSCLAGVRVNVSCRIKRTKKVCLDLRRERSRIQHRRRT